MELQLGNMVSGCLPHSVYTIPADQALQSLNPSTRSDHIGSVRRDSKRRGKSESIFIRTPTSG